MSHYELSPYRNLDESTTVFSRYSLDTGEETPLLSSPVAGSSVSSYFSEGNLYWISSNQLDTLFWVDVNGNQNQMSLDWSGGTPAFDPNSYYNFKFITLIQNHLIFDMDSDHHCAYAIDLENGQTSLLPLTYLDALSGQEKPVNILQVVGSDLLVEFASVNQQSTHYNPDGTAFLLDVPLTRTGFISIDDYLSGQNNYREFSMLVSAS